MALWLAPQNPWLQLICDCPDKPAVIIVAQAIVRLRFLVETVILEANVFVSK